MAATSTRSTTTGAWTSACSSTITRAVTSPAPRGPIRPRCSGRPWKWLSLKYSYSVDPHSASPTTPGTSICGRLSVNDQWTINAHVGRQEYNGSQNGISNNIFNYTDWKLGVTWLVAGYNMARLQRFDTKDSAYTLAGRNIGKATGTAFIQKTF